MNARTRDGTVHALRGSLPDGSGSYSVLCGLKGQTHTMDRAKEQATAATPTADAVTCLACLAATDDDPKPWDIKGA